MTNICENLENVRFIEKHWFEKTGLFFALITTIALMLMLLTTLNAVWWVTIIVLALSIALVTMAWIISKSPPKTQKNKIGFLISIACDGDEESKKLRDDFVIPLRQLVKSGKTGSAFHFMELPQHLARSLIEKDDAQSIRSRSRAHFMLFGRVRLRELEGQKHHVIDLDSMVTHEAVTKEASQLLAKEFLELMPRKITIPTENDLLSFQFTSEWAAIVAKYVIGIAAALSGDLEYAETLYKDTLKQLHGKDPKFPIYQKLTTRIPIRISELDEAKAIATHKAWTINHDPTLIDELGEHLKSVEKSRQETVIAVLHLTAIHEFLKSRDANQAIKTLNKIKDTNNAQWHYNMAFLEGYIGNLKSATRHYRQATKLDFSSDVIAQVEDFICWVLQQEPNMYQLNYCLGFFNWKTKGDRIQAKKDFTKFIDEGSADQYKKERELTQKWLTEI
jgi:tetratricopeptide (TPR) repeat protein